MTDDAEVQTSCYTPDFIIRETAFQGSLCHLKVFTSYLLGMSGSEVPSSPSIANQPLSIFTAPALASNASHTFSMPESNPLSTDGSTGYFTECLSFRDQDEFFHCMLSYRVNSEGPFESQDKGGNDLAKLIWQSCSSLSSSKSRNRNDPLTTDNAGNSTHQSLYDIERFGKWPKVFPQPTSPVRIFLDQMNLRPGVDWKGTGNRESGGFLGALSSALMLVPLLSATPVRFKILPAGERGRFKFSVPVNISIPKKGESLEIFRDSSAEAAVAKQADNEMSYICNTNQRKEC